jgi:hypothetical protein
MDNNDKKCTATKKMASRETPYSFDNLMGKEFKGVKGQAAVDLLLKEKQGHVKAAFYRDDIGEIDLFWGDGRSGLSHIVKRRKEEGANPAVFLKNIANVIEKGQMFGNNKYPDRINLAYKGKVAIIAFDLRETETTALLTAFDVKNKVGATKEVLSLTLVL